MKIKTNKNFNEWLAGLIDGDGYFGLSKKGYASLEIVMETRDIQCLYKVKKAFGGSMKLIAGNKAVRYRLHNKAGILNVITAVNGEIRNPIRLAQLYKICDKYGIKLKYASELTYESGWLAGFLDADGSVYLNKKSVQVFIAVSQKNKLLLDLITQVYGGKIYSVKTTDSFKWVLSKKLEVLAILDYFKINKMFSAKMNRIRLISDIYKGFNLGWHNAELNTIESKLWKNLEEKWESWD